MADSANVTIGGYSFICVRLADADFADIAAIYVVLCVDQNSQWTVLDVGQSGELGSRIDSHDRRGCWSRNCPSGNIWVCVYRMPSNQYTKEDRLRVEKSLRSQFNPPCGQR